MSPIVIAVAKSTNNIFVLLTQEGGRVTGIPIANIKAGEFDYYAHETIQGSFYVKLGRDEYARTFIMTGALLTQLGVHVTGT